MSHVIVFDVNETLLDLHALDPHFERVFGSATIRRQWFAQVLQSALVATLLNEYHDFGTVAGAALDMTAARQNVALAAEDRTQILSAIRTLSPHPDVRPNLERLQAAGFRLAALTNSPPHVAEAQLTNAGIRDFFEQALSVDELKMYKPVAAVYHMAAAKLGVAAGGMRLVAAHDWDVAGALKAGYAAAFIARPGVAYSPLLPQPDIIGADLHAVTDQILA